MSSDSDAGSDLEDEFFDRLDVSIGAEIDLDQLMASAAHTTPRRSTTPEHLSKVWRIDIETAKRTLDITTHRTVHGWTNPTLS